MRTAVKEGENREVHYKGVWSTTGQISWWTFEDCVREGVYLLLWSGLDGRSKVCHYPGRGLTETEEEYVLKKYRALGRTLTERELRDSMFDAAWQDAHVHNEILDIANAKKFAEALIT